MRASVVVVPATKQLQIHVALTPSEIISLPNGGVFTETLEFGGGEAVVTVTELPEDEEEEDAEEE